MYSPNFFISLPGTPTTVASSLIFSITTVPAPSVQFLPTFLKALPALKVALPVSLSNVVAPSIAPSKFNFLDYLK